MTLSIGKQKDPVSMERISSPLFNPMQEGVSDTFLPARKGAQLSGNLFHHKVSWAGGIFNPWITKGGKMQDNETSYSGRLTWVPWVLSGEHRQYIYRSGTVSPIPVAIEVNQGGRGAWELESGTPTMTSKLSRSIMD